MKRIIFAVILTIAFTSFSQADELKWNTWNKGYELSQEENKPLVIFIHASWCHQCQRFNDKTYNNEEIIQLINKDYIPVKFDIEAKEKYLFQGEEISGKELLSSISKVEIRGIPTTLFWKPGSKKVKPVVGLKDPQEMKKLLKANKK